MTTAPSAPRPQRYATGLHACVHETRLQRADSCLPNRVSSTIHARLSRRLMPQKTSPDGGSVPSGRERLARFVPFPDRYAVSVDCSSPLRTHTCRVLRARVRSPIGSVPLNRSAVQRTWIVTRGRSRATGVRAHVLYTSGIPRGREVRCPGRQRSASIDCEHYERSTPGPRALPCSDPRLRQPRCAATCDALHLGVRSGSSDRSCERSRQP
jgi:hypothetical protein